jgi:hypothetical protein
MITTFAERSPMLSFAQSFDSIDQRILSQQGPQNCSIPLERFITLTTHD